MLDRLAGNWVYGGVMAAVLLLVIAPLIMPGLDEAGRLTFLALVAYMLHQYEEHDDDRFRRFVDSALPAGRAGLSRRDVFIVNVPGVWGVIAATLWLAERIAPGWALIATWLMLVNAFAHILQALKMRTPNPGLWTAVALFVPLGIWMHVRLGTQATEFEEAGSLGIAIVIHMAILVRAMRPRGVAA